MINKVQASYRKRLSYLSPFMITSLFIFTFILISCEKEITVDLPKVEEKIVIEGLIEQGEYPHVYITRSASYFAPVDTNTLTNSIVINARVIVWYQDGNNIIEDSLEQILDPYHLPFTVYQGSKIKGEVGKTYHLKVIVNENEYTRSTTIPKPVPLDSVRFKITDKLVINDTVNRNLFNMGTNHPFNIISNFHLNTSREYHESTRSLHSLSKDILYIDTLDVGLLWLYFTDPDTLGNYYRIYSKTLSKDRAFVHPYSSIWDDKLINGIEMENVIIRGWDPALGEEDSLESEKPVSRWMFIEGEKVIIKMVAMDIKHYDFWYSVEQPMATDGNPFATPISIRSNIEGGALGVWGGYGVYMDTITITNSITLPSQYLITTL